MSKITRLSDVILRIDDLIRPIYTSDWFNRFIKRHSIAIGAVLFLVVWTASVSAIARHNAIVETTEKLSSQYQAEYDAKLQAYVRDQEAQQQAARFLTGDASRQAAIDSMAPIMAKSFYGHRNVVTNDDDFRTLGWNELFRLESKGEFAGLTDIQAVVSQPNAYMGFSDDNPVTDHFLALATEIITDYFNGNWPTTEKFVYLDWSSGKMIARNEYNTTPKTEYWWYGK